MKVYQKTWTRVENLKMYSPTDVISIAPSLGDIAPEQNRIAVLFKVEKNTVIPNIASIEEHFL